MLRSLRRRQISSDPIMCSTGFIPFQVFPLGMSKIRNLEGYGHRQFYLHVFILSHLVKGLLQLQRIQQWKRRSNQNTGYKILDIETGGAWRVETSLTYCTKRKYDIFKFADNLLFLWSRSFRSRLTNRFIQLTLIPLSVTGSNIGSRTALSAGAI